MFSRRGERTELVQHRRKNGEREPNNSDSDVDIEMMSSAGIDESPTAFLEEIDQHNTQEATIALQEFIQPEGDEVAENLPSDTRDRSLDAAYKELPEFFDRMATKIEKELLPNAQSQVEE